MYGSDLNDKEWEMIAPYVTKSKNTGRPRSVSRREIVNAIFYQNRTGCQWRMMPKDFPDYKLVMHYYYLWMRNGTLEKIHSELVTKCRGALKKRRQAHGRYN